MIKKSRVPTISEVEMAAFGRTLIVAPHPDDESLGCGGVIALLREMDLPVAIAVLSDGTLSHPNSPAYPPDRLRELREGELIEAGEILGVCPNAVEFFRYRDRSVPTKDSPLFAGAVRRLREMIDSRQIETIFAPYRRDPHPDHRAAFRIVEAANDGALRVVEYPIWLDHLASDGDLGLEDELDVFTVNISSVLEKKRRAIAAHRSQTSDLINDDPTGFRLGPEILDSFLVSTETFFQLRQ